jgi:outer membrane lipoprotein-sorting protein
MKKYLTAISLLVFLSICMSSVSVSAQDAKEIVRRAEEKFNGEKSNYSEMSMMIVRPKYQRNLEFKSWSESEGNALTLITAPAKEKGQSFLKSGNNMWNWNPSIQRLIKMPPSMLSQGWMGSDYSNDDILKESSLVKDYSHHIKGKETIDGLSCYKIELLPLKETNVIWGKLIIWISEKEYFQLKIEFYDEDNDLVKTHKSSKIMTFDDRRIPSVVEIIPADEPGNKTVVTIKAIKFNIKISPDFFSQQNMKKVK